MNAPDRTRSDLTILGEPSENASPSYPFRVTHKNGYFTFFVPITTYYELRFTPPVDWHPDAGLPGSNVILAVLGSLTILTPFAVRYYDNGFAAPPTAEVSTESQGASGLVYRAGVCYKMILRWFNNGSLIIHDIYNNDTGGRVIASMGDAIEIAGSVDDTLPITLGYFSQTIREANTGNPLYPYTVPDDAILLEPRPTLRFTELDINPTSFSVLKPDNVVAKLSATHARPEETGGFELYVNTNVGDHADFYIKGSELYANKLVAPGAKTLSIACRDRFDWGNSFTIEFDVV